LLKELSECFFFELTHGFWKTGPPPTSATSPKKAPDPKRGKIDEPSAVAESQEEVAASQLNNLSLTISEVLVTQTSAGPLASDSPKTQAFASQTNPPPSAGETSLSDAEFDCCKIHEDELSEALRRACILVDIKLSSSAAELGLLPKEKGSKKPAKQLIKTALNGMSSLNDTQRAAVTTLCKARVAAFSKSSAGSFFFGPCSCCPFSKSV
jgi:hypothetical protein